MARPEAHGISLAGCVAFAAAAMAPALAVVLNAPAAAPAAGGTLPLAFLFAFGVCLLVGNTVIQFARRLPSRGSFYTYTAHGLGRTAGFFTGWLFCLGYAVLAPGLFTALGDFAAGYARDEWGAEVPWWGFSLAGLALVMGLSLRSLRASVRVDLTLLLAEVGVFLVLALVVYAAVGAGRAAQGFTPPATSSGWGGVGVGVVFGVLSFVGFDAAATLAEETRRPRRNVPLAVAGSLVLCGFFYLVTVGALVAAGVENDPNAFLRLAHDHAPGLRHAVSLCAIVGILSCFLAVHNATARILAAMGRDGLLPAALGEYHPRRHTPHNALATQGLFTVAVGLPLGMRFGPGPAGAYGLAGAVGSVAIILVWMLAGPALVRYALRRGERGLVPLVIVPALSVLALAYPLWAMLSAGDQDGQTYPPRLVPAVVAAWLAAGVIVYCCLRRRAPGRIDAIGRSAADDPERN